MRHKYFILGSISSLASGKLSSSSSSQRNAGIKLSEALPGNHIKWASLGSVRNSRFATGFTPLKPKPLDSIMDLERARGTHFGLGRFEAPHMLFTGLEDYKARGTQAAPYLTSTFYTKLSETKDLVLIVFTSKLTDEEAKWIMETAQSFYLNDTRHKLLERFNKNTHGFEFKDVLQALDMPIL